MTIGVARPNLQGTFNVTTIIISQTFILQDSKVEIEGLINYVVNNVSYYIVNTHLKLINYFINGFNVYKLH